MIFQITMTLDIKSPLLIIDWDGMYQNGGLVEKENF